MEFDKSFTDAISKYAEYLYKRGFEPPYVALGSCFSEEEVVELHTPSGLVKLVYDGEIEKIETFDGVFKSDVFLVQEKDWEDAKKLRRGIKFLTGWYFTTTMREE